MNSLVLGSGWESMIGIMIIFGVLVPIVLFIIGLRTYRKNEKQGKIILITAAVYSIISFGVCGGFGI